MASCATYVSQWMRTISHDVFAELSGWRARLRKGRELPFSSGQDEPEHGAARFVLLRPELAAMSEDDRSADGQPHACSTRLRGVEGIKDPVQMLRIDARARITHGDDDPHAILLCADQQLSRSLLHRTHCF